MERSFCERDWALILGGSSGFGLAIARKLAQHGMNLCIVHRDRRAALPGIEAEFARIRSQGVALHSHNRDATDKEQRQVILDQLAGILLPAGRLRLVVHSIAFGNLRSLAHSEGRASAASDKGEASVLERLATELGLRAEKVAAVARRLFSEGADSLYPLLGWLPQPETLPLAEDDFAHTLHAMGTSLVAWVQDILRRGLFAEDARIVGITSEGSRVAWEGYAAVSAAKAALESVSRSMAVELARYGLRSNVIQPGVSDTPALRRIPAYERLRASARVRNPFGRLTTPEDVANVVYLLCLREAAWVNGALIHVDGGEHVAGL